jgi:hypothetical protein
LAKLCGLRPEVHGSTPGGCGSFLLPRFLHGFAWHYAGSGRWRSRRGFGRSRARYFKIFGSNATVSAAPNWSSIKTSCFLVSSSSQRLFFFFPFLLHRLQRQMSDYIPTFDLNVLATEDDEDDVRFDLNVPATQVDNDNDMIDVSELQNADDNDMFDVDEPQDDNDVDVDDEPQDHPGGNASLSACMFFCSFLFSSHHTVYEPQYHYEWPCFFLYK